MNITKIKVKPDTVETKIMYNMSEDRNSKEASKAANFSQKKKLTYKEQKELEQIEKELEALAAEKASLEEDLSSGNMEFEALQKASERIAEIIELTDEKDLMIINRSGLTIRTSADQIRVAGRATQGVKVINLRDGDSIASVTAVPKTDEEDIAEIATNNEEGVAMKTTEAPTTEVQESVNE